MSNLNREAINLGHSLMPGAESTLVRAISRAVDDAVIVAGGITADGMSELASEVIADYLDPLPWEKGAGTSDMFSFVCKPACVMHSCPPITCILCCYGFFVLFRMALLCTVGSRLHPLSLNDTAVKL
jgi:hypothetical protein